MTVSARQVSIVISFINRSQGVLGGLVGQLAEVDGKISALNGKGLTQFGASVTGAGVAMAALGAKTVQVANDMAKDFADYQKQVKGTMTQVEKDSGYTYDAIYNMGLKYAKNFPIPFEQIQPAIYDIFSSVEITSAGQAEKYMDVISKSMVGGLSTMETAGRSTITLVNAFGDSLNVLGDDGSIAVDKVTHAGDIMFQTVRKGIGSYDEFSVAFGKSAASAKTAGQSIETLGAMLAFMTRNGEPAARAGTSVARAMDMITKPNTIARFKQIGVSVTDSNGSFRQMNEIVKDLNEKFKGMSTEQYVSNLYNLLGGNEKAIKGLEKFGVATKDASGKLRDIESILKDLDTVTKGLSDEQVVAMMDSLGKGSGGTIQAMRFFKHAITDTTGSLDQMIEYMGEASEGTGALEQAFQQMNNTDTAKLEKFNNLWQSIKVSFGETFSKIKIGIVEALTPLLEWFDNLDPKTKDAIAKFIAIGAAVLLVGGSVAILAGGFLMSVGAIQQFSMAAGGLLKVLQLVIGLFTRFTVVGLIITALVAAGILLYENWDTVKKYAQQLYDKLVEVWNGIKSAMQPVIDWINTAIDNIGKWFNNMVTEYGPMVTGFWESIKKSANGFIERLQPWLSKIQEIFDKVVSAGNGLWNGLKSVFTFIGTAIDFVVKAVMSIIEFFSPVINFLIRVFGPVFGTVFGLILSVINAAVGVITSIVNTVIGVFKGIVDFLTGVFTANWQLVWDGISGIFSSIWEGIKGVFTSLGGWFYDAGMGIWTIITDVFNNLKDTVMEIFNTGWEAVKSLFTSIASTVQTAVLNFIVSIVDSFKEFMSNMTSTVVNGIKGIAEWFSSLGDKIWNGIKGIGKTLYDTASGWIKGIGDAVKAAWETVSSWFGNLGKFISDAIGDLGNILYNAGKAIMDGFFRGVKAVWEGIKNFFINVGTWIADHKGPRSYDLQLLVPAGGWIMTGLKNGIQKSMPELRSALDEVGGMVSSYQFDSPSIGARSVGGKYAFSGYSANRPNTSNNYNNNVNAPVHVEINNPGADADEIAAKIGRKVYSTVWS